VASGVCCHPETVSTTLSSTCVQCHMAWFSRRCDAQPCGSMPSPCHWFLHASVLLLLLLLLLLLQ